MRKLVLLQWQHIFPHFPQKDYCQHNQSQKILYNTLIETQTYISQHFATGDSPVRNKDYFLLFVLTFYIS